MTKVLMIVVPFMVIFGFLTFYATGTFHIPEVGYWFKAFNNLHTVTMADQLYQDAREGAMAWSESLGGVHDLPSFFNAFGQFFVAVGKLIALLFDFLAIPFEVIIWAWSNILAPIFNPNASDIIESSVETSSAFSTPFTLLYGV